MLPIAILACVALYLIYHYLTRTHDYWKKRGIPFERPLPIFGNVLPIYLNQQSIGFFGYNLYKKFNAPLVGYWIANEPGLLIKDPDVIKAVLVKDAEHFRDHLTVCDEAASPITAHMMFLSNSPEWKDLRKRTSPLFSSSKLKHLINNYASTCAKGLLDYLEETCEKNPVVEGSRLGQLYVMDSVMVTLFGADPKCMRDENGVFHKLSKEIFDWADFSKGIELNHYYVSETLVSLFRWKFIDSKTMEYLKCVFWDIITQREKTGISRNDMVDLILQMKKDGDSKKWTTLESDWLVAQAIQVYAAAFETSSSTIGFLLYELAENQEVQDKAREEIIRIQRKHGEINYDSVLDLNYLMMCLKETLRKYPIVPFLDRRCNADYKIPGYDLTIRKGQTVLVSLMGFQRDPTYFPDPDEFKPERFSKEHVQELPDFAYMPFGAGPRQCIGERFALVSLLCGFAHILSKYSIHPCDKTPRKLKYVPRGFSLHPVEELSVRFQKLT